MGHPDYEVTGGSATYKGEDLFELEPEKRSHMGLFLRCAKMPRLAEGQGGATEPHRAFHPTVQTMPL